MSATEPLSPTSPPADHSLVALRRQSNLGRALDRVKMVFKRQDPNIRDGALSPSVRSATDTQSFASHAPDDMEDTHTSQGTQRVIPPTAHNNDDDDEDAVPFHLVADDIPSDAKRIRDDADDFLPAELWTGYSRGSSDDRSRILFERYGLPYLTRRSPGEEPPGKLRRVEKAVRVRLRWTCHACEASFGSEKTCPSCGHRRCQDCVRAPPRRIVDSMRNANTSQIPKASLPPSASTLPPAGHDTPLRVTPSLPPMAMSEVTPKIDAALEPTTAFQYTIRIGRPRAEVQLVHPDKHTTPSHHCHMCENLFPPTDLTDCPICGHSLCTLCPNPSEPPDPLLEPPRRSAMVPMVERVYRKPRQRVRYTCEQCQVEVTNRHRCTNCGHERCENCLRDPPRKTKAAPSAAEVKALEEKIALSSGASIRLDS